MTDVVWLVGQVEEIGELEARLDPIAAALEETWPTGLNAEVVALVRSEPRAAEAAAAALGAGSRRFDEEGQARSAVREIVTSD
jgi:hypothetical protein